MPHNSAHYQRSCNSLRLNLFEQQQDDYSENSGSFNKVELALSGQVDKGNPKTSAGPGPAHLGSMLNAAFVAKEVQSCDRIAGQECVLLKISQDPQTSGRLKQKYHKFKPTLDNLVL